MSSVQVAVAEQRKHARVAICIKYHLTINNRLYSGKTGNISLGGVYLQTITPALPVVEISRVGQISLSLGEDDLVTNCMAVYIGDDTIPHLSGVGIAFKDVSDKNIDMLKAFIK